MVTALTKYTKAKALSVVLFDTPVRVLAGGIRAVRVRRSVGEITVIQLGIVNLNLLSYFYPLPGSFLLFACLTLLQFYWCQVGKAPPALPLPRTWSGALAGHEPTADKYFSVLHIFIST